jgi:Domain of unknown function (DUF5658)
MDRPIEPGPPGSTAPRNGAGTALVERRTSKVDRRKVTLGSLLRGGFTPRRRGGRRATDHDQPIDWHDPQLLLLALMMLVLSVADAFMTVTLLGGGAEEANPLLAFVLNEHPYLFSIVKMALTGGSVVVLVAVARSRLFRVIPGRTVFKGLVVAYFALVLYEAWLLRAMT